MDDKIIMLLMASLYISYIEISFYFHIKKYEGLDASILCDIITILFTLCPILNLLMALSLAELYHSMLEREWNG